MFVGNPWLDFEVGLRGEMERKAVSVWKTREAKRWETERHHVRDLASCSWVKMRRRSGSEDDQGDDSKFH